MSGGDWKEMFEAACAGDLELVRYHVGAGVDVNYAHPEFLSTPLVASLLARQPAVCAWLLEHGANPHLRSEFDGLTPIEAARQAGLPDIEARLIAMGVSPPLATPARAATSWWARLRGRRGR